jgi:hypothetical protein
VQSIVDREFRLVEDLRKPYFSPPSFVSDDFVRPRTAPRSASVSGAAGAAQPLLNGRYRVDEAVKHANAGSLYKATDVASQQVVALKEARPNIALDRQGGDAVSRLTKEHRLLTALAGTGIGPQALALFPHWRHTFMALEFIEGMNLHEYRAHNATLLDAGADAQMVTGRMDEAIRIAIDLLGKLIMLHERNIVFGDLSMRNIMIDPATLAIRLIDFEGAFELGVDRPVNLLTRGYFRRERVRKPAPDFGDDCYALGCVLLALVAPNATLQALQPEYVQRLFAELQADIALPAAYAECVAMLLAGDAHCLAACRARLQAIDTSRMRPLGLAAHGQSLDPAPYAATVREVFRYIGNVMELERGQRIFPIAPKYAEPLALDYGALGIAYAWQRCTGQVPPALRQWIGHVFRPEDKLPGLLKGLSGMAWVLMELGMDSQASAAIDAAGAHRLLYQHMSLGYGAAGYGMSRLALWRRSGDAVHLREAKLTAEAVCASAQPHALGCYWTDSKAEGVPIGYHHGASGIALFLLYMYCATGEARYLATGEQGLAFDIAHGWRAHGMLGFSARSNSQAKVASPYLSVGAAGVASVALRYYVLTGKAKYRQLLSEVKPALACKYKASPDLHQGLAGIGHCLLDMHEFLGDASSLELAFRLARGIALFAVVRDEGTCFPLLEANKLGCDYASGSAGVALFLDRLVRGNGNANFMVDDLLHEHLAASRRRTHLLEAE